jgi:hypothetical protein
VAVPDAFFVARFRVDAAFFVDPRAAEPALRGASDGVGGSQISLVATSFALNDAPRVLQASRSVTPFNGPARSIIVSSPSES